jgi:glycosyltransferase involved in cell wall biosynthesis
MTTLRIAHVLPSFQIGGQERVALDLARTHRKAGHRVTAFSIDTGPEGPLGAMFRAADVETRTVPKGPRVDPTLVARLAVHFATRRVDVVHTHNPMAMTYGAPAGKIARTVVVHSKHGENMVGRSRQLRLRQAISRLTDAFVAVSPTTADAARASRDVDERKLRVIPNGIDVTRFQRNEASRRASRRELGIPEDAWVVGTVGRLAPEKNQVILVQALSEWLGARTRLVIVGEGRQRETIERAIGAAGVGEWVHLTGARQDVPQLLASFDVFALPSISEGLPLVLLEAMATGLPVVASDVGGIPDVVADGITGFIVPVRDETALRERLVSLAATPSLAIEFGDHARDLAHERFSLDAMSQAYMALYEEMLAGRGAPTRRSERV